MWHKIWLEICVWRFPPKKQTPKPFQPIRATETKWAVTGSPCSAQPRKEAITVFIRMTYYRERNYERKMSAVPNLSKITRAFIPTHFSFLTSRLVYTNYCCRLPPTFVVVVVADCLHPSFQTSYNQLNKKHTTWYKINFQLTKDTEPYSSVPLK